MGLCSDGTQIRRRRGGAYRERCSGDARRAVRLLSRVKIGISVSAPPILSRICGALCCCITLSCRRHSLPIQEMPRQIDGTEIAQVHRSEEHTSELQSLMRISYAVFCLKKKTQQHK